MPLTAMILVCSLVMVTGFTMPAEKGKTLYQSHCARCHGADGARGLFGAKNLQKSQLPDSAVFLQISNGKKIMPSFRKRISRDEINAISTYIKSLRK
jgi:cytochrome c6